MRGKEGTLKREGYPYDFELTRTCEEDSVPLLVYDDADREDIFKHFNIPNSFTINIFRYIDMNHLLTYLLEEKGYSYSYEDGRCVVKK